MEGCKRCAWLTVGKKKLCEKKCRGNYCKAHLVEIKKNRTIPVPCRKCGKGTQRAIQKCSDCSLVGVSRGDYNERLDEYKLREKGVKTVIKKNS